MEAITRADVAAPEGYTVVELDADRDSQWITDRWDYAALKEIENTRQVERFGVLLRAQPGPIRPICAF